VRRINIRFLLLTLLVVVLAGGAVYGYRYWVTRPAYLYSSAESYYDRATKAYFFSPDEGAAKGNDKASARSDYERADQQLRLLLQRDKNNAKAYFLRYRVLLQLLNIRREEANGKETPETSLLNQEMSNCLHEASELDPECVEAHRTLMNSPLGAIRDSGSEVIITSAPWAARIIELEPNQNSAGSWDTYTRDQIDARFILAFKALHDRSQEKPFPEEALEHLKISKELQKKAGENPPLPRWRAVALEAHALALQAGLLGRGDKKLEKKQQAQKTLNEEMEVWLKRLEKELDAKDPGPVVNGRFTVGHLPMPQYRSATDLPGLLDFLRIAVLTAPKGEKNEEAPALKRASLAMDVCKKLVNYPGEIQVKSDIDRKWVAKEVVSLGAVLPELAIARMNILKDSPKSIVTSLFQEPAWKTLRQDVVRLGKLASKEKVELMPPIYLALSFNLQILARANDEPQERVGEMASLAEKGLERVEELRKQVDPSNKAALEGLQQLEVKLHSQAAWALLVLHKNNQAEPHLKVLRASRGTTPSYTNLLEGECALREGRLEQAVQFLEKAFLAPDVRKDLAPNVMLGYTYMALGNYPRALEHWLTVEAYLKNNPQLTEEQQRVINQFLRDSNGIHVELFRCYMDLASRSTSEPQKAALLKKAEEEGKLLRGKMEEQSLRLMRVEYYLRQASLRRPDFQKDLAKAREELKAAQDEDVKQAAGDPEKEHPFLAWAEVQIRLLEEAGKPKRLSRAFDLAGTNSVFGKAFEGARQAAGLKWQYQDIEDFLKGYLDSHASNRNAPLLWVRWLVQQGRSRDADAYLEKLQEASEAIAKRRLMVYRIELARRQGNAKLVEKLFKELPKGNNDLENDILAVMHDMDLNAPREKIKERVAALIGKHQESGLLHYWQGQLHHRENDHRGAASSFARAVEFTQYRDLASIGLRVSLLNIRNTEGPKEANEVAATLLKEHPNNLTLLQDYADTALLLDHIVGPDGLMATIGQMEHLLASQLPEAERAKSAPINGYLRADAWNKAGRQDLARQALDFALKADPKHIPSLRLATELALVAEDWDDALKHAKALEELPGRKAEAQAYKARALIGQGKLKEASKVYESLAKEFPNLSLGFLGMASIRERAGDYLGALEWVEKWKDRPPQDPGYLSQKVRLLAEAGRLKEAAQFSEDYLKSWKAAAQKQLDEMTEEQKKDVKKDRVFAGLQLTVFLSTAAGFHSAKAYQEAEVWLQRALSLKESLDPKTQNDALLPVREMLAQTYLERAHASGWPFLRSLFNNKAIDIYLDIYEQSGRIAGNNLAWLLAQERGDTKKALEVAEWVRRGRFSKMPLSGDRLHPQIVDTLATVLREARAYTQAERLLNEAAQQYKEHPLILLHKARIYRAKAEMIKAREYFGQAAQQATRRAESTFNPVRKREWDDLATLARREQKEMTTP
jgi:Tfp pilus assembly protein PilF